MSTLRCIIVCPDQDLSEELQQILEQVGHIGVAREVGRYPSSIDLVRTIRAHAPQLVFLSLENLESALEAASALEKAMPGMPVITIARHTDPQALLELMRVGIREFLSSPISFEDVNGALARVRAALEQKPLGTFESEHLYSFLPAKPGVGASTTAMNTAWFLSKHPAMRTLLMDLDLNSGMQRFMLKLDNEFSIADAVESSVKLDEAIWPQLVTSLGKLDVLHSGRLNPGYRIEPSQIRHMVEFMRRVYKVICADLSGNMEKYSVEIMQESKRIFLVTTPEIASLHLARERYQYLKSLDLGDRVELLLNRAQRRAAISIEHIENLMGIPVLVALPNDYQGVNRALTSGKAVDAGSELGKQYQKLAAYMLGKVNPEEGEPVKAKSGKKLADYLSLLPGKYGLFAE